MKIEVWRTGNVVIWENGKAGEAGNEGLNIGFGRGECVTTWEPADKRRD